MDDPFEPTSFRTIHNFNGVCMSVDRFSKSRVQKFTKNFSKLFGIIKSQFSKFWAFYNIYIHWKKIMLPLFKKLKCKYINLLIKVLELQEYGWNRLLWIIPRNSKKKQISWSFPKLKVLACLVWINYMNIL